MTTHPQPCSASEEKMSDVTAAPPPPKPNAGWHLGAIDAPVLSRLADGQPRGNCHRFILGSEQSADHRKRPLPMLGGSLHDPLRSPVVDARRLGGSVDRCAVTACSQHRDHSLDGLCPLQCGRDLGAPAQSARSLGFATGAAESTSKPGDRRSTMVLSRGLS